jgi:hypothetical protein
MEEVVSKGVERRITINLTEREFFLIKWSLEMMVRNNDKVMRRFDIDALRNKLAMKGIRQEIEKN